MMNWGFDLQGANRNRQGQNSFGTQLDDVAEKSWRSYLALYQRGLI